MYVIDERIGRERRRRGEGERRRQEEKEEREEEACVVLRCFACVSSRQWIKEKKLVLKWGGGGTLFL